MKDLLQRFQQALPRMECWIGELQARYLPESLPASEAGFTRLGGCFPASLLTSTRVACVQKIPFPPVSEYGVPEFEPMANMSMAGISFGDMYFVHPAHSSESTHFHELVHVVQWGTLGVRDFLLTYAVGLAQHGYEQSPLEAIAFDLQWRFEAGSPLHSVPERVARHSVDARNSAATVFAAHGLKFGSLS